MPGVVDQEYGPIWDQRIEHLPGRASARQERRLIPAAADNPCPIGVGRCELPNPCEQTFAILQALKLDLVGRVRHVRGVRMRVLKRRQQHPTAQPHHPRTRTNMGLNLGIRAHKHDPALSHCNGTRPAPRGIERIHFTRDKHRVRRNSARRGSRPGQCGTPPPAHQQQTLEDGVSDCHGRILSVETNTGPGEFVSGDADGLPQDSNELLKLRRVDDQWR
mgnify:CR=1 FL=1